MIKTNLISVLLIFFSMFSISRCYAEVSVGDSYGGGTVFCVSQTPDITQCVTVGSGKYGLIMANEDQANFDYSNANHGVQWSSVYTSIPAARSDDDGLGNTRAIIAALPGDNPGNNAAWLCHSYNDLGGSADSNLTDWYLPAKNELNKMYLYGKANNLIGKGCAGNKPGGVQCLVGGYNEEYKIYWSSSEYSGGSNYAWAQYFRDGGQNDSNKILHCFGVRAVRAFNNLFSRGDAIAGALAVMSGEDEKFLQGVIGDAAADGREKNLAVLILKRNQVLERFASVLAQDNPL